MNIYFDIGGTNFRYYIYDKEDRELIDKEIKSRNEDIFAEIYLKLGGFIQHFFFTFLYNDICIIIVKVSRYT